MSIKDFDREWREGDRKKAKDGRIELWMALCRAFGLEPNDIIELTISRFRDGSFEAAAVHVDIKDGRALETLRRGQIAEIAVEEEVPVG